MRLPRDVGGEELAKLLARLGYEITRQTGSHLRLTRRLAPEHHITIPRHSALRIGTLNNILKDIAKNLKISKEEVTRQLWEKNLPRDR